MAERQDLGQVLKWSFFLLLLIAATIVSLAWINKKEQPVIQGPTVAEIVSALEELGYVQADQEKKPGTPGDKPEVEGTSPVVSGSGYVVADEGTAWPDTLPVEVSVVEGPGGTPWIGTWINGKPVQWTEYPVVQWPGRDAKESDWRGIVDFAFNEDSLGDPAVDVGVGAAWMPVDAWGTRIGIGATVDASLFNDFDPRWAAASVRAERGIVGPLCGQFGVGYALAKDAENEGLYIAAGLSLKIGD